MPFHDNPGLCAGMAAPKSWAEALSIFDRVKEQLTHPDEVEQIITALPVEDRCLLFRGTDDAAIVRRLQPYDATTASGKRTGTVKGGSTV